MLMEFKNVEYIQDISFNDACDRMVVATTSKQIIIYKKVQKNSDCLILDPSEKKKEKINTKKEEKNIFKLDDETDFDSERNKRPSSKSLISIDSNSNKKSNKKSSKKNKEKNKNKSKSKVKDSKKRSKTPFNKRSSFEKKNNLNIDKINSDNENNNEFSDDLNNENKNMFELIYSDNPNNNFLQKNKEFDYHWEKIQFFIMDGPVLRIQWADNEFGNIFACSGYNKWIYVFKEEKYEKNIEYNHTLIKFFSDAVMDISFLPKAYNLRLASITLDGYLKILKPNESWKNWDSVISIATKISNNGCTCLCCNPSNLDDLTIVIGCKKAKEEKDINDGNTTKKESNKNLNKDLNSINNNNNSFIKFIFFRNDQKPKIQPLNECFHKNDITDIVWANQNGRSYHMICSTSKDGKFIIWEINLFQGKEIDDNNKFFNYKKIFEFDHDKPLCRCSFNESGIIASCIDEDGKTFSFLKIAKNQFIKLVIEKTK